MKEKIFLFYSKYIKRYHSEWELQNAQIDQLRADKYNIDLQNQKLIKRIDDLESNNLKNNNDLNSIIEFYESKLRKTNGRIGGLTKHINILKNQNKDLISSKHKLSNIINQLSKKVSKNDIPNIYEFINGRKGKIRRGK
ncbi:MAG: hypothetical protein HFI86_02060 [Bacilli bacterium]|nr:hypothetical protein [Bacilli bacterium]